jgi:hypothetical protein
LYNRQLYNKLGGTMFVLLENYLRFKESFGGKYVCSTSNY